jgi:hypothetical protein
MKLSKGLPKGCKVQHTESGCIATVLQILTDDVIVDVLDANGSVYQKGDQAVWLLSNVESVE